ncbi:MAG: response regulator transcription factor [Chloroflexi bacterium]|nr:response regulator transcription factor [Chloroflexota bacterium]
MTTKTRVAILDDHQSIVDGYLARLKETSQIEVVGTAYFGSDLEPLLAEHEVDVLMLDVNVHTSPENTNPYPILHVIPQILQTYPNINILVVSMIGERALIRAVMDAGASGYILKEDRTAIQQLGPVVLSVAGGGIYLSQQAHQLLFRRQLQELDPGLTPRQLEALSLCAAYPESTLVELATKMGVMNSTARNLLSGAYMRLGVRNRNAAIAKAQQLGLITPPQEKILQA